MGKLKEDFAAGTERQKIKFCANLIEQYSFEGKSKFKIEDELRKLGAADEIISAAYEESETADLPSEIEKAKKIIQENFEIPEKECFFEYGDDADLSKMKERQKQIRKMLSKLAYLRFDEDVISEIAEEFQ